MAAEEAFESGVDALAGFLVRGATVESTLQRIVEVSADALPAARHAGISMLVDDHVTTSVFSDPEVPEIDQAQYEAQRGPCLQSFRDGEVHVIDEMDADIQWPEFSARASRHGIRSSLSVPLIAGGDSLGALNFYSDREHAFGAEEQRIGALFAAQAAVVLANVQAYSDAQRLTEQLQEAIESRAVIEQAKGILMGAADVDADTAFEMLRAASQRENRKLREIAAEIADRRGAAPPATEPA